MGHPRAPAASSLVPRPYSIDATATVWPTNRRLTHCGYRRATASPRMDNCTSSCQPLSCQGVKPAQKLKSIHMHQTTETKKGTSFSPDTGYCTPCGEGRPPCLVLTTRLQQLLSTSLLTARSYPSAILAVVVSVCPTVCHKPVLYCVETTVRI